MLRIRVVRRAGIGLASAALAVGVAVPALAATNPGDAKKGKVVFVANCTTCHTLKAGGGRGTIGPNLDKLKPARTYARILAQVTNGGKASAKYPSPMISYKFLGKTQLQNVAAFVYASTHPK